MAKHTRKQSRRKAHELDSDYMDPRERRQAKSAKRRAEEAWSRQAAKPLVCKNQKQKDYLNQIRTHQITFGVGAAGTGKSFIALKHAAMELDAGNIDRIIMTRPIVEVGAGMGFLPGDVGEKTAPYQAPMIEILCQHFGKSHLENLMGGPFPRIEFIPLEHTRGRTYENAVVILDECQNATKMQVLTLLTRLGDNCKVIIDGDPEQCDLKDPKENGLVDALRRFKDHPQFGYVEFTESDIVRSDIVKDIIIGYRRQL